MSNLVKVYHGVDKEQMHKIVSIALDLGFDVTITNLNADKDVYTVSVFSKVNTDTEVGKHV